MKRKIIVFECQWAGENPSRDADYEDIKQYLENELPIEVEKALTDEHGHTIVLNYKMQVFEIRRIFRNFVQPYLSRAEIFVIADPGISLMVLDNLRLTYPNKTFIGYEGHLDEIISDAKEVVILAPKVVKWTESYQIMKARCGNIVTKEPDYRIWAEALKYNFIRSYDFLNDFALGTKVLVIHPGLASKQKRLERAIGWRGEVIDLRKPLVESLRKACGLEHWR